MQAVFHSLTSILIFLLIGGWTGIGSAADGGDEAPTTVLNFEDFHDLEVLKTGSENVVFDIVQDYCVTSGKNCLRAVGKMGQPWSSIVISDAVMLRDFEKYDYVALDVYSEPEEEVGITLELWDSDSVDYATRATLEEKKLRPGMNHLFWRINRAKRNNKEGREWEELEPRDKIARGKLKMAKLFFTPLAAGGDTRMWIDHFRLLPENAVGGKMEIPLPAGAIGYKFGAKFYCPKGFTQIGLEEAPKGMPRSAKDCIGTGIQEIGKDWPDTLTGNGLYCPQGDFTFTAKVPDGDYWVWVSAGKVYNRDLLTLPYSLQVGDQTLLKEKLTEREFFGEKGLFRYMRTQYSERPDALWLDYVEPEAQEFTCKIRVTGGQFDVEVANLRLSAMVLLPAADELGFNQLRQQIRQARLKYFNAKTFIKKQVKPQRPADGVPCTVWLPNVHEITRPWSAPPADAEKTASFHWEGARGQRMTQRICVTAWEDLGSGELTISDLTGPATIPASTIRRYYMNYRFQDGSVQEMTLLPWTKIRFEPNITWAYWLWFQIPADAPPGNYTGVVTFQSDKSGAKTIPLTLTVYPFQLNDDLPVSYGMYYRAWDFQPKQLPEGYATAADFVLTLSKEQFKFMREIGFTAADLPPPFIYLWGFRGEQAAPYWKAAREAGLGRNPDQKMMCAQLGIARRVARDLFYDLDPKLYGHDHVDRNPGVEFTLPEFRTKYFEAMNQYKTWTQQFDLPLAMEIVDEPREVPNPWNRRRDETIRYAKWVKELGFDGFVTFITDENMGKDYTPVVDHVAIVSVHAWDKSARLIERARKLNKPLWYYNVGMDRFSWGFYNWAMNSKGRWEWHFCFPEPGGVDGHPNIHEWYSPFTNLAGLANHAPYFDMPGGMTFRSDFFTTAEGITDYAYCHTLQLAIAAQAAQADKAAVVAEARAFLESVRKAVPEYTDIKGMQSPDAAALVGQGLNTPVAHMTDAWRKRIANQLIRLQAP